jgi:ubiquinone biosynthesis monooxygenase Coq7
MPRKITLALPGDKAANVHSMVRVNHAGELAAVKICEGQMAAYDSSDLSVVTSIEHTIEHELEHLRYFKDKIRAGMKSTVMLPLWDRISYALGYIAGKFGATGIAICTYAVEREIAAHYTEQLEVLPAGELRNAVQKFYDDEVGHRDGAAQFLADIGFVGNTVAALISFGCRVAIEISKRV